MQKMPKYQCCGKCGTLYAGKSIKICPKCGGKLVAISWEKYCEEMRKRG